VGVLAQQDPKAFLGKGFLVDVSYPGLVIGEQEGKIGTFHGQPASVE
jgi:hypothetical protein